MKWSDVSASRIKVIDNEIQSDGCTAVPDFYRDCCVLHDWGYRRGTDPITGESLTRAEVDARFRQCIQGKSRWGRLSPMAWWRWAAVRTFGGHLWLRGG